jgi:hypothetical protein
MAEKLLNKRVSGKRTMETTSSFHRVQAYSKFPITFHNTHNQMKHFLAYFNNSQNQIKHFHV